jgi:DNA-directed RNA polymerase sigma subunit (sigma70/sigma32)
VGRRKTPPPSPLTAEERAEMLAKHEAACWFLAGKLKRHYPECDLEDLAAEVRFGFVRAVRYFDPARGVKFLTYAYPGGLRCARILGNREAARGVRVPIHDGRVIYDVAQIGRDGWADGDGPGGVREPADERTAPATFPPDFWAKATACLTERQRAVVFAWYREGLCHREIGARLGVTAQASHMALHEALRKMRRSVQRDQLEG